LTSYHYRKAFISNPNNEYLLILPIDPFRCPCFGIGMIENEQVLKISQLVLYLT